MSVAAGTAVFTPRSVNELFSPRGQLLFKPAGSDREVVLGEVEDFSATPELTESEYRSKSYPKSLMVKRSVFATAVSLGMTLKSLNARTLAMLFMANVDSKLVQTAIANGKAEFAAPQVGDIFDVGAFDIAVSRVATGETAWVAGEHYAVDNATGRVEVLALPSNAATIVITFSAPAITAADNRQAIGILESEGVRGQLSFRELGAEGPFNWLAEYWDVEIRPSGDIPHMGGDEFANIELTGTVYARSGKPAGQEYGRIVTLAKR